MKCRLLLCSVKYRYDKKLLLPRLYVPKDVAAGGAAAATSVGRGSQKFSAVAAAADVADDLDPQVHCQGASFSDLDETEIMKLKFYSKFSPTPVSLGHFLNHGSKAGYFWRIFS